MQITSKIDGHVTHVTQSLIDNPKLNVLIIHGMAEHRFRYKDFIETLNLNHYNAYALDLRGHGESKHEGHLGYFGKKNGYLNNIHDIHQVIETIREHSDLPLVLLGHSMGSLFARALVKHYPDSVDALIISGSPYPPLGMEVAKLGLKIPATLGPTKPSRILLNMMNANFNKDIKDKRTALDWLSFDKDNVDAYINDPLCNFPFTYQGYYDLFSLMDDVYRKPWKKHKQDLPILFLIGSHDPCTDFKRNGFEKAITKMTHEGYHNIHSIIYENSRHELLNDVEKEKVTDDIIQFINNL